jgi:plastocyanin
MKKLLVLLLLAACFILISGCTQSSSMPSVSSTPASTPSAGPVTLITPPPTAPVITPGRTVSVSDNTITIMNNAFSPADMAVRAGSTVRWVNADDHPHRIEFANKAFSTSTYLLAASQSFSQRFDSPGTYDYDCMIHTFMHGTITVVE